MHVPQQHTTSPSARITWWQWPTILSLDAPAVVVIWQHAIARAGGVTPGGARTFVLGTSVWLAYVADRWLEGWRLGAGQVRTERHRFYQRRRWLSAAAWAAVLAADLTVAGWYLSWSELRAGLGLLLAVLTYLLSHQLIHRERPWRAPKELCIAGLLAAGVGIFVVAAPHSSTVWISLGLFTVLCASNCVLISRWEHEVDRAHGQTSIALQFGDGARLTRLLPWVVAAGAAVLCIVLTDPHGRTIAGDTIASGVLLGGIDVLERRAGWRLARVLADVALMTPLVTMWHVR